MDRGGVHRPVIARDQRADQRRFAPSAGAPARYRTQRRQFPWPRLWPRPPAVRSGSARRWRASSRASTASICARKAARVSSDSGGMRLRYCGIAGTGFSPSPYTGRGHGVHVSAISTTAPRMPYQRSGTVAAAERAHADQDSRRPACRPHPAEGRGGCDARAGCRPAGYPAPAPGAAQPDAEEDRDRDPAFAPDRGEPAADRDDAGLAVPLCPVEHAPGAHARLQQAVAGYPRREVRRPDRHRRAGRGDRLRRGEILGGNWKRSWIGRKPMSTAASISAGCAQAQLYHHYRVPKYLLPRKDLGRLRPPGGAADRSHGPRLQRCPAGAGLALHRMPGPGTSRSTRRCRSCWSPTRPASAW